MDADAGAEYLASIFGTEKDKWVFWGVEHLKFGKNGSTKFEIVLNNRTPCEVIYNPGLK